MEKKKKKKKTRKPIEIPGVDWERVTAKEIQNRKNSGKSDWKGGRK